MFVLANFLLAFAKITDILLSIYMWLIIARAVLSWVNPDPYNPIVNFLYRATEPVLYRLRRVIPDLGGLDLSPLLVILAIYFLKGFAVTSVMDLAMRLKMGSGVGGIP